MSDNSLVGRVQRLESLKADLKEQEVRHKKEREDLKEQIAQCWYELTISSAGLDLAKIELAEKVLSVGSKASGSSLRKEAVQEAISEISKTDTPLSSEYIGIKVYSGFGEQREDHKYGYGPRHGSIVFRIGARETKRTWTDAEREAAIYYLLNIELIQSAEAKAA